jgi:hypothetical protein
MARGWESKAIEDQQAEAERKADLNGTPKEASATDRRRTLELARTQLVAQLQLARTETQRQTLQTALDDLERRLESFE